MDGSGQRHSLTVSDVPRGMDGCITDDGANESLVTPATRGSHSEPSSSELKWRSGAGEACPAWHDSHAVTSDSAWSSLTYEWWLQRQSNGYTHYTPAAAQRRRHHHRHHLPSQSRPHPLAHFGVRHHVKDTQASRDGHALLAAPHSPSFGLHLLS
ncbi:hypothetical protein E2C01_023798 [Portunus trituberculatus]|uniref:Uncharacterized protein n=1 Tax=Portunus trituberculatus TaxID=210409 RepID=A0A5B7E8W5_PORTR|nr:hypothetical protein [Portunus trituberculatus]